MNAEDSLKLARRFIGLPLEKRQLFLQALQKEGVDFSRFPIPAGVEAEDRQALSYAQQRMWFLWQLDPASGAYNLPGAVRLKGALDITAMEQAFASLVARHETLRTVFQRQADERLLQVAIEPELAVEQLDLSHLAPEAREQAVNDAAISQSLLPFDLANGPLLRVQLLRLDAHEHVLLLTLHHIVSDGWSMNVLIDEFIRFYDAHERNQAPQLLALPIQYSDYALWQRRWLEAGEQARQLEYWQARLGDEHPVLELPPAHARPAMPSYRGTRHNFAIEPALAAQLRGCAQKHNVTLFMLLLGAFNVLLHRYTGQGDIRIGVPIANRNRSEVEGLIGFFVNTQVLRTELTGQTRIAELLQSIKEHALGAQAHQELPFERLVEALKVERSLSHTPLFQVMYNHQPVVADIASVSTASGLELALVEWQSRTTQFDLTLDTYEKSGTLHAALTYANDLFDAPSIERMALHWTRLLQAMVADGEQRIGELPMLDGAEQQVLVRDWNHTAEAYPTERGIHHLIQDQVQRTPDAPALVFGSTMLTYAQLDARANQLAHALRERGVGPDVLVGICVERSIEMVVGLLAIHKAGGAYVPLDPEYPEERLAYMIEDSSIQLLLSQRSLLPLLSVAGTQVIVLDQAPDWLDGYSQQAPAVDIHALNLAYVIYTSGSTGKPKGAGNSHRALVNRLCWMQQAYGLEASDAVLQKTPFSFDVSVWEFFWPLMTGARLVVAAPGEHREPARLIETIGRHGITTLHFVPSMLQAFIHEPGVQACSSLQRIVCSGEALPLDAQLQVFAKLPQAGLYNLYGPTEAAIDVTHWTCVDEGADSVPIGRPIANLGTWVLDAQLNPVPAGVSGELYLGGVGLARSYHRRPALTAERFVPSPFVEGERLYRTGDRVRQRGDGVIEYLGRLDHQVKLRGLRIELGEIETRLMQHPAVREAVVLVQGGKQLVAYLVLEGEAPADLKAWLLKSLPEYMVPTHMVHLAKLPVTANGKLDRKALPLPDAAPQQAYSAPENALQKALAAIWSDVLGTPQVGLDDNFFELGGDSIISIQVVSRARQAGIRLSPRDLFQYQSVRSLALVATFEQATVIDQGPVTGEVILTPVQASFFEQAIPVRGHWNQSLLLTPREHLEPARLDAALTRLINHHDALRLRFTQQAEGWQQTHAVSVVESDLWVSEVGSDAELAALCDEAQRSLDLQQGPLLKAALVQMANGTQRLLLVIHHLVVDGVSWRILLEDLQQAYRDQILPAKTSAYQHWAQQLQNHAHTLDHELSFWQAQSIDADLPCDNPQGGLQNHLGAKLETRLNAELTRQLLQDAPAAYRTQVNDLLLTALARVISRWSGQQAALIQLEGHGREDLFDSLDLTRTVGWFTSLFPVRLQADGELGNAIKSVKEQLRAVPAKGIGYGLLRYLGTAAVRETLASQAAPRITFNYLGQFDRQFDESALFVPASQGSGQAQDSEAPLANWLTVEGQVYGGELSMQWGFSHEMFLPATIQALADAYQAELRALVAHCCALAQPQATPSDFPLALIDQAGLDRLPVPLRELEDLYALSPMQQGILFHSLIQAEGGSYINQMRLAVQSLHPQRFQAAWQATLQAHPILRSGFIWQDDLEHPVQVVYRERALPLRVEDWRGRPDAMLALDALADEEQARPFDVLQAPLLRLVLVQTTELDWEIIYTHHHVLMDGWSNSRVLGEVLQRYSGQAPAPAITQYRDYIGWLQRQDRAASEAFWREQLSGLQAPTRLVNCLPMALAQEGYGDCHVSLDAPNTERLQRFAIAAHVTLNTLLQAAWLLVLQRYSGQDSVCFGATVSGRPTQLEGAEQQIGLFINTLPIIAAPRGELSVAQWLQRVQQVNLQVRDFEHTPLADIQRWAGQAGEALFDNILVFDNYPVAEALREAGDTLQFGAVRNRERTHYPLTLVVGQDTGLTLHLSFDRMHLQADTVERLSRHLVHMLEQLSVSAERRLGELPLLGADEQRTLLGWNATAVDYPLDHTVQALIEAQVARTPDAPALIFGTQQLSYAQLNACANRLAHRLIGEGVGADVLVGIAAERSLDMVIGLLAVLKAGGAYVPVDPDYPAERLAYLFADSGIELLLTQQHLCDRLPVPATVQTLVLEHALESYPAHDPQVSVGRENLAYVIYTSGSTGQPKGAANRHVALTNRLCWMQQAYGLGSSDTVLQKTPYSFDVSVWEFFWPLMTGARLVIAAPGDHRDPARLVALIEQHQVSTLHFVPSMLQAFMQDEQVGNCRSLRRIICSGEALPVDAQQQVFARLPDAALYNLYGPTEAAIDVTHWTCREESSDTVPIGQPIANLSCYVLDADFNPLPAGVIGELYLGGEGLARGYHRRAALTAERFVTSPFGLGERLYRTGDLARQRADGVVEYAGRIDHQVKIRGLRIELGEIEARMLEQPQVHEAVVVALGQQLIGYVTGPVDVEALKERLRAMLPEHMVPATLLVLEAMPLSANGKLDRKALPQPDFQQHQQHYVAPVTPAQQALAQIWQQVLKIADVGLHDNFFELGGDSIISIQVVSRARRLGLHFSPNDLFRHPTVEALAGIAAQGALVQVEQGAVTGELALLPAQHWFFEQAIPEPGRWNQSLVLDVQKHLDADVLAQALRLIVQHHDGLRLRFTRQQSVWAARFDLGNAPILWQRTLTDESQWVVLADEAQGSLDLQDGPLLRAVLATVAGQQRLMLVAHHLVIDGVSWRVLMEDLQSTYLNLLAGQPSGLAAKTHSLQAWRTALAAHAASPALAAQVQQWQTLLAGAEPAWPCPRPQGSRERRHLGVVEVSLDALATRNLLQQAPTAYRTQVNDLLLTALARAVTQWSGSDELLVQLESHGREVEGVELDLTRTLGWFTAFYPVRLTPVGGLGGSLKAIKEQLRAVPGKGSGFGVLRYLGDESARAVLAALPVPAITFNYLGQFDAGFAEQDALFTLAAHAGGREQSLDAPLASEWSIDARVEAGQLHLVWTFSTERYDSASIQAVAHAYTRELSALIEHCCEPGQGSATPADFPLSSLTQAQLDALPVALAEVQDIYPLSPMQQGMLLHSLFDAGRTDYINQIRLDVTGLDTARFVQAWQDSLDTHDILRSAFHWAADTHQPQQLVMRRATLPLTYSDLSGQAPQAFDELAEAERQRGFDVLQAPLLRLHLAQMAVGRQHVVLTYHHALLDGWSTSQLLGEVLQRYAGLGVPAPQGRYRDYIGWLAGQDMPLAEAFWKEQLAVLQGPTRLADAIGLADPQELEGRQQDHQLRLDSGLSEGLQRLARERQVTLNTVVQLAWGLLLQRLTGETAVTFGATVAGRPAALPAVEQQIGLFINTLPLTCAPRPEQPLSECLAQLQANNARLREFEHAPLTDIQRWAGQPGEALFDHILVFENYPVAQALREGAPQQLQFANLQAPEQTSYPLTVLIAQDQGLSVTLRYAVERFSEAAMQGLAEGLRDILQGFIDNPDARVGEMAAALNHAQRQRMARWNATAEDFTLDVPVQRWIEAQPADEIALLFGDRTLSYGELNARANSLAHGLIAQGVGPETLVGVASERSLELVVALLAVLKTGAAYVPLDPEYPAQRLAYMLEDSAVQCLLAQPGLDLPVPEGVPRLDIEADWSAYPATTPQVEIDPQSLAYMIYTSGSTGQPKGAANRHSALTNRLCWMQRAYGLTPGDTVLQKTPFSFDVSVWEFFWPLMFGARLAIAAPGDHRDPARLVALIERHQVTTLHFVPSMLQVFLLDDDVPRCQSLTRIICSGEALAVQTQRHCLASLPAATLYNLYGPTEAAIDVTHWTCREEGVDHVPIGEPISNVSTWVLDANLEPLAPGVIGELYLGGEGLARGYHRRPGLTAERFVTSPFGQGERLYRTGDLARYRPDGVIEYAGRIDHQVKIRGLRVELGEIEARLMEQPQVREAAVLAIDQQLVAYVTGTPALETLKTELRAVLPEHMVPAQIVLLDSLPLSPNGKLDRKALPQPQAASRQYRAPHSDLQRQVAEQWRELLGVQEVGLDDNFFEQGGHSLLATRLVMGLRKDLAVDIPLEALFATADLEAFCARIEALRGASQPILDELAKSLEALKRLSSEELENMTH